jgi:hypothetical protein
LVAAIGITLFICSAQEEKINQKNHAETTGFLVRDQETPTTAYRWQRGP